MLEDIAILTGGQVVSEERGFNMDNVTIEMLGRAEKVSIDKDNTTIVNGAGNEEEIKGRVNQIKLKWNLQLLITIKKNCKKDWLN